MKKKWMALVVALIVGPSLICAGCNSAEDPPKIDPATYGEEDSDSCDSLGKDYAGFAFDFVDDEGLRHVQPTVYYDLVSSSFVITDVYASNERDDVDYSVYLYKNGQITAVDLASHTTHEDRGMLDDLIATKVMWTFECGPSGPIGDAQLIVSAEHNGNKKYRLCQMHKYDDPSIPYNSTGEYYSGYCK